MTLNAVRICGFAACVWLLVVAQSHAEQLQIEADRDWTTAIAPFRIADGLYYVGSRGLASYLIVTPAGDVLINSNLESSVPLIRDLSRSSVSDSRT